jgi:F420-dependent oxidoreductase-like protein
MTRPSGRRSSGPIVPTMDLRIFTEPQQGASHSDLLQAALATRAAGFSAFFRSDHVLAMGDGDGLPGPSDSIASLAALTAQVPEIRFGTLVTAATFRHPSMLAIAAATIDDISGGRLDLGLGAGWFEAEHKAYGLDFGSSFGERFDRLTEQLEILTGLWATPIGETFSHHGTHYRLQDAPGLPKPLQRDKAGRPKIPLVLGGSGPKRTPALAARFADDYNVGFSDVAATFAGHNRVRAACAVIDRNPDDLVYSAAQVLCCGRTPAELARRAAAIGEDVDGLRTSGIAGSVDEIVDKLGTFAAAGTQRVYLQVLDLTDLDHIALVGEQVLPQVAAL